MCGNQVIDGVVADHHAGFGGLTNFLADFQVILDSGLTKRHVLDVGHQFKWQMV